MGCFAWHSAWDRELGSLILLMTTVRDSLHLAQIIEAILPASGSFAGVDKDVACDLGGPAAAIAEKTEVSARTEPPLSPEEPEKTAFAERIFMRLRFNKSSTAFNLLLLGSQLACDAADRGAELRPDWACGAKVFVEGALAEHFADDLDERDVIIRPEDEEELELLLLQWPYKVRPRQQQAPTNVSGEVAIPDTPDAAEAEATSPYAIPDLEDEVPWVIDRRSWSIELATDKQGAVARSRSAPGRMPA